MMGNLLIEESKDRPYINFVPEVGLMEIKGRSVFEDPVSFYTPVWEWVDLYTNEPAENITIDVELEYFNTSSAKCIHKLLKKFENIKKGRENINILVNWFYQESDEDMHEAGEGYQEFFDIPFMLVEIPDKP